MNDQLYEQKQDHSLRDRSLLAVFYSLDRASTWPMSERWHVDDDRCLRVFYKASFRAVMPMWDQIENPLPAEFVLSKVSRSDHHGNEISISIHVSIILLVAPFSNQCIPCSIGRRDDDDACLFMLSSFVSIYLVQSTSFRSLVGSSTAQNLARSIVLPDQEWLSLVSRYRWNKMMLFLGWLGMCIDTNVLVTS